MHRHTLTVIRVASGATTRSIIHNTPAMDAAYIAITRANAYSTLTTDIVKDTITHCITGNILTIKNTHSTPAIGIASNTGTHCTPHP